MSCSAGVDDDLRERDSSRETDATASLLPDSQDPFADMLLNAHSPQRDIIAAVGIGVCIYVSMVILVSFDEDMSLLNAAYFSAVTITTVGAFWCSSGLFPDLADRIRGYGSHAHLWSYSCYFLQFCGLGIAVLPLDAGTRAFCQQSARANAFEAQIRNEPTRSSDGQYPILHC